MVQARTGRQKQKGEGKAETGMRTRVAPRRDQWASIRAEWRCAEGWPAAPRKVKTARVRSHVSRRFGAVGFRGGGRAKGIQAVRK